MVGEAGDGVFGPKIKDDGLRQARESIDGPHN